MNQKLLNVLVVTVLAMVAVYVIYPYLPKEMQPTLNLPNVSDKEATGDGGGV